MPDYPWELDGWAARKKATWPLQWESKGLVMKYSLVPIGDTWWRHKQVDSNWYPDIRLGDHEAACLVREHWRAWLATHGVSVWESANNRYLVWAGGNVLNAYDGYDTAQGAAVDVVLKEKSQ